MLRSAGEQLGAELERERASLEEARSQLEASAEVAGRISELEELLAGREASAEAVGDELAAARAEIARLGRATG